MFITNIQRFSLDDGPGIRTTIFLAGCNMRCLWCHNPETFEKMMLSYDQSKCTGCGRCVDTCRRGVHLFAGGVHQIKWDKCKKCLECIKVCENKALFQNSKEMNQNELLLEIKKDIRFYKRSSGGVTFSGGEPLLQKDSLQSILWECKRKGIHTAVETAGNYSFELIEPLLDHIDLILMDCKAYSEEVHKKCTGKSNKYILENIQKLSDIRKNIWIRIPVIWNVNITWDEIEKIAVFLEGKNIKKVELLPYHKMGIAKYRTYGKEYSIKEVESPGKEQMEQCYKVLKEYQLPI